MNSTSASAVSTVFAVPDGTTVPSRKSTSAGKPDSGEHVVIVGGGHPQERGHRKHGDVEPGGAQVLAVDLEDASPLRVQVGLGEHADGIRAAADRGAQELDLGAGELLRGVGDEDHARARG